ncbi:MAG: GHMP kinase [Armatimonadetes bacterium]|nr:GHMP kinase [Armatimonadota bacterium]
MHDPEADFHAFDAAHERDTPHFFAANAPVFVARAPGRLDVMGGIADYSGSLVAEMPIAAAAVCACQRDDAHGGAVTVRSLNAASEGLQAEVTMPAPVFTNPVSLLRWLLERPRDERWAGYLGGCVSLLRAEGLIPKGAGARFLLRSEVPLGAGVSSSAAVEVAAMRSVCAAFGIVISPLELARLCQRVENDVMDAPCGVMDQVTSVMGEAGKLLLLLCQPHTVQGTVALPDDWTVFGIDSGVKHSVAGVGYTNVRVAAFMGYKILSERAKSGFNGYLCNVTPERYVQLTDTDPLPETLSGADFLREHNGIFDTVTVVDPAQTYPVRAATAHPVFENVRVAAFVEALRDGSDSAFVEAGRLMLSAHRSYSDCGIGTPETDLLVELAAAQGESVAGAKITGGGSGGTVCVLLKQSDETRVLENIRDEYTTRTGIVPRVIQGTSPGAWETPVRKRNG